MKTKTALTAADIDTIVAGCRAEAAANGWAVSIVVVDGAGIPWRVDRGDGAALVSPRIAEGKAYTAAMLKAPTGALEKLLGDRPGLATIAGLTLVQGGVPIMAEGECVGAVGISGVQAEQDEQVAFAGVQALGLA